jgi:hypothetical protein
MWKWRVMGGVAELQHLVNAYRQKGRHIEQDYLTRWEKYLRYENAVSWALKMGRLSTLKMKTPLEQETGLIQAFIPPTHYITCELFRRYPFNLKWLWILLNLTSAALTCRGVRDRLPNSSRGNMMRHSILGPLQIQLKKPLSTPILLEVPMAPLSRNQEKFSSLRLWTIWSYLNLRPKR